MSRFLPEQGDEVWKTPVTLSFQAIGDVQFVRLRRRLFLGVKPRVDRWHGQCAPIDGFGLKLGAGVAGGMAMLLTVSAFLRLRSPAGPRRVLYLWGWPSQRRPN